MIMKTLSLILFFLCISFSALHAQSLRDSISLEIVSFVDEENAGHYTSVQLKLENHTKDFKYLILPSVIYHPEKKYWPVIFEVEFQDKTRHMIGFPLFDLTDGKRFLLPGESLVATHSLFDSEWLRDNASKIVRFRFYNGVTVTRHKNIDEIKLEDLYFYQPPEIATDWVDFTTADFDFLRK